MNHVYNLEYQNVRVRPLEHDDIESLRVMRNDTKRSEFLSHIDFISPEIQESWFKKYISDENIYIWAIDSLSEKEKLVGSAALYNFRNNKCEQGKIMISPEYGNQGIGTKALKLIANIGFSAIGIEEMDAYVNKKNTVSLKMFKKAGYIICDERPITNGGYEYYLTVTKAAFNEKNDKDLLNLQI